MGVEVGMKVSDVRLRESPDTGVLTIHDFLDDSEDDEDEDDSDDEEDEEQEEPVKIDVPVAMWDFNHCDPKRCSGKKLARFGLIIDMKVGQKFRGISITPKGKIPISMSDREIVATNGLAVVECSWARLDEVPFHKIRSPNERLRECLLIASVFV